MSTALGAPRGDAELGLTRSLRLGGRDDLTLWVTQLWGCHAGVEDPRMDTKANDSNIFYGRWPCGFRLLAGLGVCSDTPCDPPMCVKSPSYDTRSPAAAEKVLAPLRVPSSNFLCRIVGPDLSLSTWKSSSDGTCSRTKEWRRRSTQSTSARGPPRRQSSWSMVGGPWVPCSVLSAACEHLDGVREHIVAVQVLPDVPSHFGWIGRWCPACRLRRLLGHFFF